MLKEGGWGLVHALPLRPIVTQLGVSRTAAYRRFKGKGALFSAIGEGGFVDFGNVVQSARKDAGEGLCGANGRHELADARFADEQPAPFDVMFAVLLESGAAEIGGCENLNSLEEGIREAQETGEIRPGESSSSGDALLGLWFTAQASSVWTGTTRNRRSSDSVRRC
jgi:AcrR family transcriptional regulator